jgi:hypothetical protein
LSRTWEAINDEAQIKGTNLTVAENKEKSVGLDDKEAQDYQIN